jgi:hypothetical protein
MVDYHDPLQRTLYQIRERATDYLEREDGCEHSIVSLKVDLDEIARLADGALESTQGERIV